jgi:hypothetical protein
VEDRVASGAPGAGSAKWFAAALLLSLLAFAIRVASIDRLLPQRPEPDTFMVSYLVAKAQGVDPLERDQRTVLYCTLLPDALRWIPERVLVPEPKADAPLAEHLAAAARPIVIVRLWIAALSSLLPLLTFLVMRRFLEPWAALLAAALVATSLLHSEFSQQARPHAAHASLAWLALWGLLRQVEKPSPRTVVVAAALVFLAVGSFQTGLLLLSPLAVAGWSSRRELGRRAWLLIAGGIAFVAAVALFHPPLAWTSGSLELGNRGHRMGLSQMNGGGLWWVLDELWSCDPVLTVLGALGSVFALVGLVRERPHRAQWRQFAVVTAYALPLAAVLCAYDLASGRYVLPLLPVIAALAARGVAGLAGRGAWDVRRPSVLALALASLAFPTWVAMRFAALGREPDTLQQAAKWLEAHAASPREPLLVSTGLVLPVAARSSAFGADLIFPSGVFPWLEYERERALPPSASQWELAMLPYSLLPRRQDAADAVERYLAGRPAGWAVVEDSNSTRRAPALAAFREVLARKGKLVAEFCGETSELAAHDPIDYQNTRFLAARILGASALGPRVEIYRWER